MWPSAVWGCICAPRRCSDSCCWLLWWRPPGPSSRTRTSWWGAPCPMERSSSGSSIGGSMPRRPPWGKGECSRFLKKETRNETNIFEKLKFCDFGKCTIWRSNWKFIPQVTFLYNCQTFYLMFYPYMCGPFTKWYRFWYLKTMMMFMRNFSIWFRIYSSRFIGWYGSLLLKPEWFLFWEGNSQNCSQICGIWIVFLSTLIACRLCCQKQLRIMRSYVTVGILTEFSLSCFLFYTFALSLLFCIRILQKNIFFTILVFARQFCKKDIKN